MKLAEHKDRKGKVISAEEFAASRHAVEVAEYEPVMKWEGLDLTAKQLGVLKRAHIDPATVRGRGHASKLIDLIFKERKLVLASPSQRSLMRRMNHPAADTATADEAARFFGGLRGGRRHDF